MLSLQIVSVAKWHGSQVAEIAQGIGKHVWVQLKDLASSSQAITLAQVGKPAELISHVMHVMHVSHAPHGRQAPVSDACACWPAHALFSCLSQFPVGIVLS